MEHCQKSLQILLFEIFGRSGQILPYQHWCTLSYSLQASFLMHRERRRGLKEGSRKKMPGWMWKELLGEIGSKGSTFEKMERGYERIEWKECIWMDKNCFSVTESFTKACRWEPYEIDLAWYYRSICSPKRDQIIKWSKVDPIKF